MKSRFVIFICCMEMLVCLSCKERKSAVSEQVKEKDFLPVTDFLSAEIKRIDTVPYAFTDYVTINEKTDTLFLNKQDFHKMIDEFLEINICDKKYVDFYDETSLLDTTTGLASFTYLANSPKMKVSRIDVYVDPQANRFRRIYIVRNYNKGDTMVQKQLLWQTTGNFVLITSNTINDKEIIKAEKVIWDEKDE
ncbi:MAG TPA: hypothetical protein VFN30_03735 [Chitinophagaceae bacterium]|nr:hypothetical protein [Chitinophagaceae bacterium]